MTDTGNDCVVDKHENKPWISSTLKEAVQRCVILIAGALFIFATVLGILAVPGILDPVLREKYLWVLCSPRQIVAGCVACTLLLGLILFAARKHREALVGLFLLGIGCRILFTALVADAAQPFSDYDQVWRIAQGTASGDDLLYKSFFPEWANWASLQKFLVGTFGISFGAMVWVEGVLCCMIAVEVFALASAVSKSKETALLASCLYVYMPSQILYTIACKPDTPSLTFILLGMIVCSRLFSMRNASRYRRIACTLIAGAAFSVGTAFKPLAMVAVIAFSLCWLIFAQRGWWTKGRTILSTVVPIAIMAAMVVMTPLLTRGMAASAFGMEISSSAAPSYLCIGLNTEGEGQVHIGSKSWFYNELRMSGMSEQEAADRTKEMLIEDWAQNGQQIPKLFAQKIRWAWQDDLIPALCVERSLPDMGSSGSKLLSVAAATSQFYYVALMLLGVCFCVDFWRERREFEPGLLFIVVYILGFTLLLLLSESQSRYKSNVLPLISILAAMGAKPFIAYCAMQWGRARHAIVGKLAGFRST